MSVKLLIDEVECTAGLADSPAPPHRPVEPGQGWGGARAGEQCWPRQGPDIRPASGDRPSDGDSPGLRRSRARDGVEPRGAGGWGDRSSQILENRSSNQRMREGMCAGRGKRYVWRSAEEVEEARALEERHIGAGVCDVCKAVQAGALREVEVTCG